MVSNDDSYRPARTVLLTGAGFTKSFGGYLGSEMWAAILNQPEVQRDPKLRECMILADNLNYEAVYSHVLESSDYSPGQRRALTSALRRAYREMDAIVRDCPPEQSTSCRYFLRRFADVENPTTRGFVFTLNQDLFVERYYSISDDHRSKMRIPGLNHDLWFSFSAESPKKFEVSLPNVEDVAKYKERFRTKGSGQFMYVKLHGSYGWSSQDGTDAMVIGYGKKGRIDKEPLLSWYLTIFKEVLHASDRNLVIIGYGFGDEHINEIIASAINERGLRLHVICPMEPDEFRNRLRGLSGFNTQQIAHGHEIWKGVFRYYRNQVTDFYTAGSYAKFPSRAKSFFRNIGLT